MLFIMLHKMDVTFESVHVILQVKIIEEYFTVLLITMLYKVVLTFESVGEIFKYDHSNERFFLTYRTVEDFVVRRCALYKLIKQI